VELFGKERVKPFRFSTDVGHYTAMIWSNTNKVGCGVTEYVDGKWFAKLYTCNYGPAGNYIGGQMYKQGRACSQCPSGTSCSLSYPGLCSKEGAINFVSNDLQSPKVSTTTRRPATTRRSQVPTRRTTKRPTTTRRTTTTTRRTTTTTRRPILATSTPRRSVFNNNTNSQRFTPRTTPRPTSRPRLSVSTTTERFSPRPKNPLLPLLFGCDFTQASDKNCSVKFSGKKWQLFSTANERFYEVVLQNKERTEMFFSEMAPPPTSGIACLNFRYRKFLDNGGNTALQVLAWPYNGRPGKVNVMRSSPNPATWIRAQVTFRKVDNFFIVLFRAVAPNENNLYMAIDDVSVTEGACN